MINKKINKILVPMDGSPNSDRGLNMAISIARQCGATLTGIYVIHSPPHTEFRGVGSVSDKVTKIAKKFMEDAKLKAAQNGIVFKSKIISGDIGFHIVKASYNKKEKFDLIIIGSRGRSAAKEMFLGSVSNYVVHASKVPILIVK